MCGALFSIAANLYLAVWTGAPATAPQQKQEHHLLVYIGLGCGSIVLGSAQTLLLTVCSLHASRRLHGALVRRVLRAPLAFFDANTTGAILNRFLSDTQDIDSTVPDALLSLASQVLTMATQIGLVLFFAPWVALGLPPLFLVYYTIYQRIRAAARDARRIGSMAHTPLFAHYADALAGRETVRNLAPQACIFDDNTVLHVLTRE